MAIDSISKRMLLTMAVVAIVLAAGCSPARYNRTHQAPTSTAFISKHPWLLERLSHWRQEVDLTGERWPGYSDLAAFPIGNGQVFAYEGVTYPLGTLENVVGPTYQKDTFLGKIIPLLYIGDEVVAWKTQRMEWISPGGVVKTQSWTDNGLWLQTYDFVPPYVPAICRVMIVGNGSRQAQRNVALALAFGTSGGEKAGGGLRIQRGKHIIQAGFVGARARVQIGKPDIPLPENIDIRTSPEPMSEQTPVLRCELGTLQSGKDLAKLAYAVVATNADRAEELAAGIEHRGFELLDDAHRYWQERYERTVTVETPDQPEVGELLTISKYLCAVQQAKAGGYSPMDGYSYTWIRDSNGPVRYLAAVGDFGSVRRHLEYHFQGCAAQGKIGNNLPLDLEVKNAPQIDWSQVPVEPAESSSFVILQHYWYYQQSGDLQLIRRHWPMLRRCLLGQAVDERGLLPFHGDETYRFPGYEYFDAGREVGLYVNLETRSADSAFEYVAAAEALAEMADKLGKAEEAADYRRRAEKVRQTTERYYWQHDRGYYAPAMSDLSDQVQPSPFAPINLRPLWIGYAPPTEQQRRNILNSLKYLWQPDSTPKTTPEFEPYVTMILGYTLYALASIDHPAAEAALNGLLAAAEKSGGFAEMNEADNRPSDEIWGQHRVRPWEGGINAEAILHYLTGMEVDAASGRVFLRPQMPSGWSKMTISNLPVGEARLRLEVHGDKATVTRQDDTEAQVLLAARPLALTTGNQLTVLQPGEKKEIDFTPSSGARASLVATRPFVWGPPKIPAGAKTVVFTWCKETAEECRQKYGPATVVFDTKLPWPTQFLREALLRADGGRRVDTLVLDTDYFPGAFKRKKFWKDGAGAKIVAEFKRAGGRVVEPPVVRKRSSQLKGLAR